VCIALLEPRPGPVDGYGNSPTGGARGSPSQVTNPSRAYGNCHVDDPRRSITSHVGAGSAHVSLLGQQHPKWASKCPEHRWTPCCGTFLRADSDAVALVLLARDARRVTRKCGLR